MPSLHCKKKAWQTLVDGQAVKRCLSASPRIFGQRRRSFRCQFCQHLESLCRLLVWQCSAMQCIGLQDFPGVSNTVNNLHLLMVASPYIKYKDLKIFNSIRRKSPQTYRALQCFPILGSAKGSQSSKKDGNA